MSPWEVNGSERKRDRRSSTLLHTLYGPARVMQSVPDLPWLEYVICWSFHRAMRYGLWSMVPGPLIYNLGVRAVYRPMQVRHALK